MKPLLKREVKNEMSFTSLKSYIMKLIL